MKKFILKIFFILVLNGSAFADLNFKLENCKNAENVEADSSIYSYEFFGDLKQIVMIKKDGIVKTQHKYNLNYYEQINKKFIVNGSDQDYKILILEKEKIIIKTRLYGNIITKEKCKGNTKVTIINSLTVYIVMKEQI